MPPRQPRRQPAWLGRLGTWALQGAGLLGTSHLLDALARLVPGHAASRLALEPAIGGGSSIGVAFAFAIGTAILVAILEEIFFRGLVFEGLQRRLGLRTAILGSAFLFGLAHLDLHQGVAAVLLGVQLGGLRALLGLPLAVFAHALNNAAALLAWAGGLETSGASLAIASLLSIAALHALARLALERRSVLQQPSGSDESSEDPARPQDRAQTGDVDERGDE